jgi:hypothetical protein
MNIEPVQFSSMNEILHHKGFFNGQATKFNENNQPIIGFLNDLPIIGDYEENLDGADCWFFVVKKELYLNHLTSEND